MSCDGGQDHLWLKYDRHNQPRGNWICQRCGKRRRTKNRALRRVVHAAQQARIDYLFSRENTP